MGRERKPSFNPKDQRRDGGLLLLVMALFLFVAALFVEGERGSRDNASVNESYFDSRGKVRPSAATLNRIDRDLHESQIKTEIRAGEVENENSAAGGVEEDTSFDARDAVNPLVFDQENPGERVLRETQKQARPNRTSPDQRIAKKLERDEWIRDYERRRNDEYVRQFLENARRNGYEVQLNENLEVTGLQTTEVEKPIRIPQSIGRSPK